MAIRINENTFSLLVNRNLTRVGDKLEGVYRRLSSGERITRAADDPAGLANSHILRAKITGLNRNLMNSNEGLNLLGVAESSLSNITDILQRLRELAVQASSDTQNDLDRRMSQAEVDQLLDELQRTATTCNYNEKNLLDGSFQGMVLQVGTREGETMPVTIEDSRTSVLGATARVTGALSVSSTAIAGTGDLIINGTTIPATTYDNISVIGGDASAIAKAAAINSMTYTTGVTAKVVNTTFSVAGAAVQAGALDGTTQSLSINGVNIGPVTFAANDATGTLRARINGFTSLTGVTATLGSGGELVLTAADGRNVQVQTAGTSGAMLGLSTAPGDVDTVAYGTLTLTSAKTIQVGGTAALIGLGPGQTTTYVDPASAIASLKITSYAEAQQALDTIDAALSQVLTRRASLGALESRVNQTISDLSLNVENLTAADSRIRDADFAVETATMTQTQIIQQAGIAILSQANVVPQMVLNLLQK